MKVLSRSTYCDWRKDLTETGKERFTRDITRDATKVEIQEVMRAKARLKTLVAELSLQVHILKKSSSSAMVPAAFVQHDLKMGRKPYCP
jgi:hypothetical protein